jgi:uncharacterized glyoxalase superfamily protein PhnB
MAINTGIQTSLHPVEEMHYGEFSGSVQDPFGNQWYIATYHGPNYIPEGLHTVNPSLLPVGADRLIAYLKEAFGAEEMEVFRRPEGGPIVHAKIRLGDTILEMGEAHGPYGPMPTGLHYYVADVDAVYERALKAQGHRSALRRTSPMAIGVLELRTRREFVVPGDAAGP